MALEQKLKEEREASSALKLELEKVKSSLTETETRLKDAVEKNGSANSKYLQDLLNKASDNYAELYGRLDQSVQEHAKEVERLRSEHTQELQRREKEWAAERERLQKQVEEKDSRISALEEEVEQVMEETYDEAMVLQKRISGLKDECDALDLEVEERDNEIQRLTEELASGGGRKKRKRTTTPGPRTGSGAAAKVSQVSTTRFLCTVLTSDQVSKSELDGLLRPAAKLLDIPVPAEKVEEEVDDVDGEEEIDENGQSRRKKKKIVARIWISDLPTTTLPPRGRQASTRNRSYVHIPRKRRTGTQGP